jgi:hypothetical protein
MLYLGLQMRAEMAAKLLKVPGTWDPTSETYDSGSTEILVNTVLTKHERKPSIRLYYLDKGVCILGLKLEDAYQNLWKRHDTLTETLKAILDAKLIFKENVKALGMDLSEVWIEYMEDGTELQKNPEPTLLEWW